jgi:hypothetical protein
MNRFGVTARAALAAAGLCLISGCERPAPSPVRTSSAAGTTARRQQPMEQARSVPHGGSAASAAEAGRVVPASFEQPAPASAAPLKSEEDLAAEALSRIGPPAVPMLVEALGSPDLSVRKRALEVLLRMGPDAKEAVPALVALLEDEDEELRKGAAVALGRIGPDSAPAVPALMKTMLGGAAPQSLPAEPRRFPQ